MVGGLRAFLFVHKIPGHGKKAAAQRGGYPGLHQGGPGPGQGPASLVASSFCHIFPATNLSVCKQADPPRLYLITWFSSSSEPKLRQGSHRLRERTEPTPWEG